jgi:hypothetical protein
MPVWIASSSANCRLLAMTAFFLFHYPAKRRWAGAATGAKSNKMQDLNEFLGKIEGKCLTLFLILGYTNFG